MGNGDLVREPVSRKLRIFAFDPSVSAQFDTAGIGEITIAIPWEKRPAAGPGRRVHRGRRRRSGERRRSTGRSI